MIYLALGSNLGNRFENFRKSVDALSEFFDCKIFSQIINTKALLLPDSPESWDMPFLNMMIGGETSLTPLELLVRIKNIEKNVGRDMTAPIWSPRIIDIDIVYYHNEFVNTPELQIPHKGIKDRDFLQYLLKNINVHIPEKIKMDLSNYSALNYYAIEPKLIGIVNVTPDSFSDGDDCFNADAAVARAKQLYNDGAYVIEFGAQSTRPNYTEISAQEELNRLFKVLEQTEHYLGSFGIDTYYDEVARYVLQKYNFKWINDLKSKLSDDTIKLIADKNAKFVTMLMGCDIIWLNERVKYLKNLGLNEKNIIVDPGIGFMKTKAENVEMLRNITRIKNIGCEIMVGHSRKSFMSEFSAERGKDLDIETIAVSNFLHEKGVEYLRIHNVKDHMKFFIAKKHFSC